MFLSFSVVLSHESQDQIISRNVTNVKCPTWFFSQILQKACQRGGDNIYILDGIMSEFVFLTGQEFRCEECFQIRQGWTAEKGSVWDTSQQWHSP